MLVANAHTGPRSAPHPSLSATRVQCAPLPHGKQSLDSTGMRPTENGAKVLAALQQKEASKTGTTNETEITPAAYHWLTYGIMTHRLL